jgi:hypothetical protein
MAAWAAMASSSPASARAQASGRLVKIVSDPNVPCSPMSGAAITDVMPEALMYVSAPDAVREALVVDVVAGPERVPVMTAWPLIALVDGLVGVVRARRRRRA